MRRRKERKEKQYKLCASASFAVTTLGLIVLYVSKSQAEQ